MIELTDFAYVRSGGPSWPARCGSPPRWWPRAGRRRRAWGRAPTGRRPAPLPRAGRGGLRGHLFGLHRADEDALALAETDLERRGFRVGRGDATACRSRPVGQFVGFDDPFGNRVELVAGQHTLGRPVQFAQRAGITEFGHLCLDAPDVAEAYRFWSSTFNARVRLDRRRGRRMFRPRSWLISRSRSRSAGTPPVVSRCYAPGPGGVWGVLLEVDG
jgi:2,3-dihydroxy-p-cumate/2,3-dihydroxybenzoate 3,4-dioxygenase